MSDSLFIEFPPVSMEEWEAAARADLKGKSPGKILYGPGDAVVSEQPWPARAWQMWAEAPDLASAKRALACGAEGLVVEAAKPEWAAQLGVHVHVRAAETSLPDGATIAQQIAAASAVPDGGDLVVPVSPLYFEEIAKFRALRRLKPAARLIARTSRWHATAYDPHVNLLRATTGAMSAIIGGCDALIVGAFTEARGKVDELAERLALNTQLLLRDESGLGWVADPAAGSWYIESLTERLLAGADIGTPATAFVGVNRYPNPREAPPEMVTPGRAMSKFEENRRRSEISEK